MGAAGLYGGVYVTWRLAKSLQVLRAEVDRLAPARRKAYDGTIGDAAHAARPSAHNPNDAGVVCALDLTHDPDGGLDCESLFEYLRTHPHKDLRYIIHNGKRAARPVWAVGKYAGENPHKTHIHITVGTGSDSEPLPPYDDLDPWLADWGQDMTPDQDKMLRQLRLSALAQSHDIAILKAILAENSAEVTRLEAAKDAAVKAERIRLGL